MLNVLLPVSSRPWISWVLDILLFPHYSIIVYIELEWWRWCWLVMNCFQARHPAIVSILHCSDGFIYSKLASDSFKSRVYEWDYFLLLFIHFDWNSWGVSSFSSFWFASISSMPTLVIRNLTCKLLQSSFHYVNRGAEGYRCDVPW